MQMTMRSKDKREKSTVRSQYIDACCEGLTAYALNLSRYELSERGKTVFTKLLIETLMAKISEESLARGITSFYSCERGILERGDFYRELFDYLICSREFSSFLRKGAREGNAGERT